MNSENHQKQIDHDIKMGEAWERLKKDPDYITVFEEGYLKQKVLDTVSLIGVPQNRENGKRIGLYEDLNAASNLQYFLFMIEQFYAGAKDPVLTDEEKAELEGEG